MMMIVDLYSAFRRAPPLLRYVSRCKRSDAERWITEMIRQQVPDHRTCHGQCPTSEPTATMTWYDQLMASGRSETLTTGNVKFSTHAPTDNRKNIVSTKSVVGVAQ